MKIITENKAVQDIAYTLWDKLKNTCNGDLTKAEILGFEDMAIWRVTGTFPFSLKY